jgi:hypothetical protein
MSLERIEPIAMTSRRFWIIAIACLLAMELGLYVWNRRTLEPSGDPVFTWPAAQKNIGRLTPAVQGALSVYRCDRASELHEEPEMGVKLHSYYLEWDRIEASPFMEFTSHEAEMCNEGQGFRLLSVDPLRHWEVPGAASMEFDATRFRDPAGQTVYVFKTAWIQGLGSWQSREAASNRKMRLERTLTRHAGQGRVLMTSVHGALDSDEAWSLMRAHVLEKLVWSHHGAAAGEEAE